jgi:hypothetical protein
MKVVPLEGTTMTVPELVELARGEAVILTRGGQPVVSVRELSGADWESASLAHNPRFAALIEQSRRSYRDEGGIGLEQLRRELGLEPGAQDVNPGAFSEPTDVKPPD